MRKPSELIRLAVQHWSYPFTEKFLCRVLERMKNESAITWAEYEHTCAVIDESIQHSDTLSLYLFKNVSSQDSYVGGTNGGYFHPNDLRLQFWAFLTWDLTRKCQ